MTGAVYNPDHHLGKPLPYFDRYRQFYLAPDIDLTRINTRNQTLKTVFKMLDFIKIPLPGLQFSEKGDLQYASKVQVSTAIKRRLQRFLGRVITIEADWRKQPDDLV
ncbi:hypothetical protein MASR1M74_09310 [Lentimicrobium sp.]